MAARRQRQQQLNTHRLRERRSLATARRVAIRCAHRLVCAAALLRYRVRSARIRSNRNSDAADREGLQESDLS